MQSSKFYSVSSNEIFDDNNRVVYVNSVGSSDKNFPERDLAENNSEIQNFINEFIDGRAGTINSFESSRMEN